MPRQYRVIVLPEAFDDIDAIVEHIKQDSPRNAAAVIDRLWKSCQSLDQLPHRYKTHRSAKDAKRIVHSLPVPPFIIYYRVVEKPATVRILTIRHGAQRQPHRFK
jgi:plasmid stabilization system protein ParE